MVDILIKNIGNLSKECNECLRTYIAMNDGSENLIGSLRVDCKAGSVDCPLVALPEHGRLGDLDLVEEWMRKKHKEHGCPFNIDAFLFALRKIPTIVEANE